MPSTHYTAYQAARILNLPYHRLLALGEDVDLPLLLHPGAGVAVLGVYARPAPHGSRRRISMSADSCGCDREADHMCTDHQIEALKVRIRELEHLLYEEQEARRDDRLAWLESVDYL